MIEVTEITKRYGKVLANDKISLSVKNGELAVLLGPNGAGKSTLIKSVCGLLRFDGRITIGGHDNRSAEAKRILGYIPEIPSMYPMLTVYEHLEFIAKAYRLDGWETYADELLNRFELDDKKDKLGKELSKGMQQKVSVCCAVLPKPAAVIFDEPLVGLDPHAIRELKTMIKTLKQNGCAVEYYNSLSVKFKNFVDIPELSDGIVFISCTLTKLTTPVNPELPKIPGYYFNVCTCSDKLNIGTINLRIGYNKELYYSGHTGYYIYEQYRGKGYAVRACRLLIPILKAHNITKILITNANDNHASMRVCEKLGAKFIRTAHVPEWHLLFTESGRIFQNIYEWDIK